MAIVDTRKLIPGYRGKLFADDGTYLAQVNTWQVTLNLQNSQYQPGGSPLQVEIFQGLSQSLTFTEALIKDAQLLKKLFDQLRAGTAPNFGFAGLVEGLDGTDLRIALYNCVPTGGIDVAHVAPGDVLSRQWSFSVNDLIDPTKYLGS